MTPQGGWSLFLTEGKMAQLHGRRNGLKANVQMEKLGLPVPSQPCVVLSTPFDVPFAHQRLLLGRAVHVMPTSRKKSSSQAINKEHGERCRV